MARNICLGLSARYPEHEAQFRQNLGPLLEKIDALDVYGKEALSSLSCRKLITFHDGFAYFAQAFDLEILAAVEEESGSEASAKDLIALIRLYSLSKTAALPRQRSSARKQAQGYLPWIWPWPGTATSPQ